MLDSSLFGSALPQERAARVPMRNRRLPSTSHPTRRSRPCVYGGNAEAGPLPRPIGLGSACNTQRIKSTQAESAPTDAYREYAARCTNSPSGHAPEAQMRISSFIFTCVSPRLIPILVRRGMINARTHGRCTARSGTAREQCTHPDASAEFVRRSFVRHSFVRRPDVCAPESVCASALPLIRAPANAQHAQARWR
jgi:hypothetical protein